MADDLDKENQETDFGIGDRDEFDDFNNQQTLSGAIQNNAAVKIGIIAAAFVLIIGGFLLFGGSSKKEEVSSIGTSGSGIKEAPTTSEVTDSYKEAIREFNEEGEETATNTGESFIPIPTGPAKNTGIVVPGDGDIKEDPLERWRLLQEERAKKQVERVALESNQKQKEDPEVVRRREAVEALSKAMLGSMDTLAGLTPVRNMSVENIMDDKEYYEKLKEEENQKEIDEMDRRQRLLEKRAELAQIDPTLQNAEPQGTLLVPEGTIEYAQMLIQANSDIPGPVLAQIVTGPLAGSRVIGSFSVEDEYLVIEFKSVVVDGRSVPIEAVAVDPDTNLTGVVTEVDHRYFKRLVLPVAANFVEGLAGAIAQTQTTTNVTGDVVVVDNTDLDTKEEIATAIEDAGEELSDFLDQEANRTKILVKVAAGTPIGILFTSPVIEGLPDDSRALGSASLIRTSTSSR